MLLDHGQNAPPVLGPRPSPGLPKSAYIGLGECYVGYGYECRQGLTGSGMKVQRGAEGRHRHSAADPWLVHRATREALSEWSCRGIATQLTDTWLVRWATRRLLVSGRVGLTKTDLLKRS